MIKYFETYLTFVVTISQMYMHLDIVISGILDIRGHTQVEVYSEYHHAINGYWVVDNPVGQPAEYTCLCYVIIMFATQQAPCIHSITCEENVNHFLFVKYLQKTSLAKLSQQRISVHQILMK